MTPGRGATALAVEGGRRRPVIRRSRVALLAVALVAAPPAIGADARATIHRVVRTFETEDDRSTLRLDATLEMLDLPRSDPDRRRLWLNVPTWGYDAFRRVFRAMRIVRLSADRATVDARASLAPLDVTPDGEAVAGKARLLLDRIVLWRTHRGWRIRSVARRVRE